MIGWARYPELKSKDGAWDHDSENIALVCLMTIRSEEIKNTPKPSNRPGSYWHWSWCKPCLPLAPSYTTRWPDERVSSNGALGGLEGIESLVGVSNKRQTHLSFLRVWHSTSLSTVNSTGIFLRDLVDWEVRNVNVGTKSGLEGSTNRPQLFPNNTSEEGMILDLSRSTMLAAVAADTVLRVTQEAISQVSMKFLIGDWEERDAYLRIKDSDSRERTSSSGK